MNNPVPSAWLKMPVEQLKEVSDRMKAINNIQEQEHRQNVVAKKAEDHSNESQMQAMKDTLPYLDRG